MLHRSADDFHIAEPAAEALVADAVAALRDAVAARRGDVEAMLRRERALGSALNALSTLRDFSAVPLCAASEPGLDAAIDALCAARDALLADIRRRATG
jgi:hypothetical protein